MANFNPLKIELSIRSKLVAVIAGLILFCIVITSAFQFYFSKEILQSRISSDLSVIVKSHKSNIIHLLEGYVQAVLNMTSRRLSRIYLVKFKDNDPGAEAAKNEALLTLRDAMLSDNSIEKIDLLDMNGKVIISTDSVSVGKDLSSTNLFLEGRDGVIIGNIYLFNGSITIDVAVPIFNPFNDDREKIGVFRASIDVTKLHDIVCNHQGPGNTGEVLIGYLDGEYIQYINHLRHKDSALLSYKVHINSDRSTPMKEGLANKQGIIMGYDYRGEYVLAAYDYIPLTGWAIVGKIDAVEAFLPIKKLFLKNIIVGCGALIISILLIILYSNIFVKPINKLTKMAIMIASGNFCSRVDINRSDEIGRLGQSFNNMAENLQVITASRDELNMEIKKRRDAEEEVRTAYEQLKELQLQLLQSSKMASLGQLAGGVAHEINNPLTGVLNNVQLIKMITANKKELKPEEFSEILNVIEASALRCKKIIQSLLDFSHASKGEFKPVNLNAAIDEVLTIISTEIRLSNIEIKKELEPDLADINGDPQLLPQVILGLIANAKWAIDKKGVGNGGVITIKTWQDPQSKNVMASVSDNGIGISEDNIHRIFEPFFTTKDVGEGTGLGLALIYSIVRNHKGEITAESKLNAGTTFKISFPYT